MQHSAQPLFKQGTPAQARLVFYLALSFLLLLADAQMPALEWIRKGIGSLLNPLQTVATSPAQWSNRGIELLWSLGSLHEENQTLKREQLFNRQKLHELESLKIENAKLRTLMGAAPLLPVKRAILAEVMSDARDPYTKKIRIDKGMLHGIREGMPVIDELGLVGQVTRSFAANAEVTLITDKDQLVPVENLRNGLRSVAYGGADGNRLELRFMPANSDIQKNDLMITSGLDGSYPRGIPVARVVTAESQARFAYANIFCAPVAGIERHRFMLVLETHPKTETSAEMPAAPKTPSTATPGATTPMMPAPPMPAHEPTPQVP